MTSETATADTVFETVSDMLRELLGADAADVEIVPDMFFHDDLGLESIDLVRLAAMLRDHYGERVNLAEWLADKELDEVVELTVRAIVRYVAGRQ